ncbi:MAG: hypothetical protein IKQ44_10275 [Lachnospiraceae bacterium]|nr:hypothetical protein [Lachnospiraceae bacterium]
MNKDWSAKNKEIQGLLSKESTFGEAIKKLIEFRDEMLQQITWIIEGYPEKAFYQLPFAGAKGDGIRTKTPIQSSFRSDQMVYSPSLKAGNKSIFNSRKHRIDQLTTSIVDSTICKKANCVTKCLELGN